MPTKIRRTSRRPVQQEVPPGIWRWLIDDPHDPNDPNADNTGVLEKYRRDPADLWEDYRDSVMAHWVREHPGTRPSLWWKFDAPEPRKRLGGTGDPIWIALRASKPVYERGIPGCWLTAATAETYATFFIALKGVPVDPDDPPLFESEPAYLRRLGLFLPGESARLRAAAFYPEVLRFAFYQ